MVRQSEACSAVKGAEERNFNILFKDRIKHQRYIQIKMDEVSCDNIIRNEVKK